MHSISSAPQPSVDHDDFERFYREHVRRVYSFAAQRVSAADAEEITTDVFLAAAVSHRDGRTEHLTVSWLMTVCRNRVIDRWRMASRRGAKDQLLAAVARDRSVEGADHHIDLRDHAVIAALDALSDRHRTLLILHHVDGTPIRDLADATGLSVAAVESALARARRAFRRAYGADT